MGDTIRIRIGHSFITRSQGCVDSSVAPSLGCVWARVAMHIQTKLLRLSKPVSLGYCIDDWRVCWLGGWDRCRSSAWSWW